MSHVLVLNSGQVFSPYQSSILKTAMTLAELCALFACMPFHLLESCTTLHWHFVLCTKRHQRHLVQHTTSTTSWQWNVLYNWHTKSVTSVHKPAQVDKHVWHNRHKSINNKIHLDKHICMYHVQWTIYSSLITHTTSMYMCNFNSSFQIPTSTSSQKHVGD